MIALFKVFIERRNAARAAHTNKEWERERRAELLALARQGLAVRRAHIKAEAARLYGYTGPIDIERDAACGRSDLTPEDVARLFPRTVAADESKTHQG